MAHARPYPSPHPLLTGITVALAVAIVAGMVMLWPGDVERPEGADLLRRGMVVEARVNSIEVLACGSTTAAGDAGVPPPSQDVPECRAIQLVIEQGPDDGEIVAIEFPDLSTAPALQVGETVLLERPPVEVPGAPTASTTASGPPRCSRSRSSSACSSCCSGDSEASLR